MRSRRTEAITEMQMAPKPSSTATKLIRRRRRRAERSVRTAVNIEYGHWGGDVQCPKPGAGLLKPKGAGKKSSEFGGKQVKVAERLNTEHVIDDDDMGSHEVMMVNPGSLPFAEALSSSKRENPCVPGLAKDKAVALIRKN